MRQALRFIAAILAPLLVGCESSGARQSFTLPASVPSKVIQATAPAPSSAKGSASTSPVPGRLNASSAALQGFMHPIPADPSSGSGSVPSPEKVERFEAAKAKALGGAAEDQLQLGILYHEGLGVAQSDEQAAFWYRKAAEQGDPRGQTLFAWCCLFGRGVPKDMAASAGWYRKAADQGVAEARIMLARAYRSGQGVPRDPALAVSWLRRAAEDGSPDAMMALAQCYQDGFCVDKDLATCIRWLRRAAEKGSPVAKMLLAQHYQRGLGVERDWTLAVILMRESAESGYWAAQQFLSAWYAVGELVPRDDVEALAWLLLAVRQEPRQLQGAVGFLRGRMSPNDQRRAEAHCEALAEKMPPRGDDGFWVAVFQMDDMR